MMHPEAVRLPRESAEAHVRLQLQKGMAIVFLDGQVWDIVSCWHTLWSFCGWALSNLDPNQSCTISWCSTFGDPLPNVVSLTMTPGEWKAAGLDDEDAFWPYLVAQGLVEDDADEEPPTVGHA